MLWDSGDTPGPLERSAARLPGAVRAFLSQAGLRQGGTEPVQTETHDDGSPKEVTVSSASVPPPPPCFIL